MNGFSFLEPHEDIPSSPGVHDSVPSVVEPLVDTIGEDPETRTYDLANDSFSLEPRGDIASSPGLPFVWDSEKFPTDINLQAAIPPGRLHAEGKRIKNVPQALSASRLQRVAKICLFNSKIRNLPERISFLLHRYGTMHFDMIYTALGTLPDTAYVSRSHVDKVLENASLINIRDSRPWPVCSLRGHPVILPDPVAQVRFTERQLNQKDMPGWDPNFVETLSLPILPPPKKRRLFLMKIRSSDTSTNVNKSNGLELGIWKQFSRTYSSLATKEIRRVDTFRSSDLTELANLLEFTDIWACEHTKAAGSLPWPPLFKRGSRGLSSHQYAFIQTPTSFGTLDVHVISLSIEGLSSDLSSTLVLRDLPGVDNVTFHIATGRTYTNMLGIQGINAAALPRWFDFTIEQLATSLRMVNELETGSGTVPTLHTDLDRWVYATWILHINKQTMYQSRLNRQHRNQTSTASIQPKLKPIALGKEESRLWKIENRNSMRDWDHEDTRSESGGGDSDSDEIIGLWDVEEQRSDEAELDEFDFEDSGSDSDDPLPQPGRPAPLRALQPAPSQQFHLAPSLPGHRPDLHTHTLKATVYY
jgi:hypothetical protein